MEQKTNAKISKLEEKVQLMEVQSASEYKTIDNVRLEYETLKSMYDNIQSEINEIKALLATK